MKAVVFDIGNVLIRWDPHLAWLGEMGSREAVAEFLTRIDFQDRNLRADGGENFADLASELDDAEDRQRLSVYVEHYAMTVPQKIEGTWQLLYRLKEQGTQVHAITNWSAETWPVGVGAHPELGDVFDVTIVSGQEKLLKPQPEIFHRLCERAGLAPENCIFIDDGLHNVDGARAVGMDGIHFTTPQALESALIERGLL
ncbi:MULTISPECIES: HAD family phosphatase [unclassified Ruegeria]|uniref:HAD family hydrolase n=1 Tax=unclassified Ruegeria TaxID=2625375 RepID=UPI0014914A37|nr:MULTISPECIES: HAD family phosphatase [unclassified Ruegeria]NOD89719.1 HAD-IA family hydrolase [Ruegeria sp. HKCCD4318]NOE14042.1 HAD-IA family hydrolase [Ruegeria sp. HKCCD4318-2]NOG08021.1 HAD family phosphatase [Ruegeria sp. HKCCD4315]